MPSHLQSEVVTQIIPTRDVQVEDALAWFRARERLEGCSIVSSMPDKSEFPTLSLNEWKTWFVNTAGLLLSRCPSDGVCIFFQSDIRVDGTWIDKAYLCQKAAEESGHELLFHKIVCRSPVGTPSSGRPAYSHLIGFSEKLRIDASAQKSATADVLPGTGEKTWGRGMGLDVCLWITRFIAEQTTTRTLVNPFCGEGGLLAAANAAGLHAIGIERSPKRAEISRRQQIASDGRSWTLSS